MDPNLKQAFEGNRLLKARVQHVLKGRLHRSVLSPADVNIASRYYEALAKETKNKLAPAASQYNEKRARFLRGQIDTIEGTLPEFIANQAP